MGLSCYCLCLFIFTKGSLTPLRALVVPPPLVVASRGYFLVVVHRLEVKVGDANSEGKEMLHLHGVRP